jgi:hypothetical protein
MVLSRFPFTNPFILKPGKAGKHIYRRIDSLPMNLPTDHNLPFCDVARQVSNGMGFVILRHGEDRDESD